jgi:hypothetical protein
MTREKGINEARLDGTDKIAGTCMPRYNKNKKSCHSEHEVRGNLWF